MSEPGASELRRAIASARRVLIQTQRADGSWDGICNLGPMTTAQVAVVLRYLGQLSTADATEIARWLRAQQQTDGSFLLYPSAPRGDLGATAFGWAALHATDATANADAILRARRWIDQRGGVVRVIDGMAFGDLSAVYLAMAGVLDAKRLPCPSVSFLLCPPVVRFLQTRFHSGVLMMAFELSSLIRRMRGDWGADGSRMGVHDALVRDRGVELLRTFQNTNGSWNDSEVFSTLAVAALHASGFSTHHPMVERAVEWVRAQGVRDIDGLHFHGFGSEVWATAFDTRALIASGTPPSDPVVSRALQWLVDAQLDLPMPAVDNRQPGAVLTGGWAFQRNNHTMPDCDDAGVVLTSLGMALRTAPEDAVEPALAARIRLSIQRGHRWLEGMQNPDGGWSAYVWGLPGKEPGPMMQTTPRVALDDLVGMARLLVDPPASLGDPSTEDVTARVLHGLGVSGFPRDAPPIARALAFLQRQQCATGAFWGRWVLNYLSSTAFVLMGVSAVGVDPQEGWIRRAVRWVQSKQNPDGGWGEGPESYRDPSLAGIGSSMPPLTALVLQGLIDAGEATSSSVQRGIAYLLSQQQPDGSWPNHEYLHVNIAPDTFFIYPEATRFYPPAALGMYAQALASPARPSPTIEVRRWTDAELAPLRQVGDPRADSVVKAIFERGALTAVNDLLGRIFRSDELIPSGLPSEAAAYFEETRALPSWADRTRLERAHALFTRCGWDIATALFCSSLPQAYAAANGAHVLMQTQGMTRHVRQRIFETAQFLFDVADTDAFSPNGRGTASAQKVRLIHAGIRHLLLTRPDPAWDHERRGVPVNQEDLAGTLMTFSVVPMQALQRMGVPVTAAEAEAWLHRWNVVGHLLGVRDDLLPQDLADGAQLMEAIRRRQWAASEDGAKLAAPLVALMKTLFPGKGCDGLPVALIRHLAGDHCSDLLQLPAADWTRLLVETRSWIGSFLDDDFERRLSRLTSHATHLLMHAVVLAERDGKHARFRIPPALRHAVDPQA